MSSPTHSSKEEVEEGIFTLAGGRSARMRSQGERSGSREVVHDGREVVHDSRMRSQGERIFTTLQYGGNENKSELCL